MMLDLLPPDYVILDFEADQLQAQGDYAAAKEKRREAAEAKRAAF